jgi:hypothetical protein
MCGYAGAGEQGEADGGERMKQSVADWIVFLCGAICGLCAAGLWLAARASNSLAGQNLRHKEASEK